jgi:hypothetical protein
MLKELNKLWFGARRQAAAWKRWQRKLPHNRVRRPRIRDDRGRVIGYGPPTPLPEPQFHPAFCRRVALPSGATELLVDDAGIEAAYRLARHPKATKEDVAKFPLAEDEIRRLYQAHCAS